MLWLIIWSIIQHLQEAESQQILQGPKNGELGMLNEEWNNSVEAVFLGWHKNFSYLKRFPMYHCYLSMIGMAKSANHLQKFYDDLPSEMRLLRDDWIKIYRFWKETFNRKDLSRRQLEQWILYEQSICWKDVYNRNSNAQLSEEAMAAVAKPENGSYFIWKIEQCESGVLINFVDGRSVLSSFRVLSAPGRSGNGYRHFQVNLFGNILDLAIQISEDRQHAEFRFVVKENQIDEELAYKITTQSPPYFLRRRGVVTTTMEGRRLHPTYEFDAKGFIDLLNVIENDMVPKDLNKFCKIVADFLRSQNIPIEGDLAPILESICDKEEKDAE